METPDSNTADSNDHTRYNRVAIETAQAVHEARGALRDKTQRQKPDLATLFPAHNLTGLGVTLEYAAMGNQPVTDALQAQADELGVEFEHLGKTLGTVLHNIDLRNNRSPELITFIRAALLERKVIFFRDQNLTQDEQVSFSRCFGELDAFPFGKPGKNPYILEIIHDETSPGAENGWHTDVTWMEQPSLGSIAQCIEVPPDGGDTLFADSAAAYHGLSPENKTLLQNLQGINDYRIFLAKQYPEALVEKMKQNIPYGVSHPLLRTHPETGKTVLYIHGGFLRHDSLHNSETGEYLDPRQSKRLVKLLLEQHGRPEYSCRFKWTAGSMAFWDNRAVQHYAASDYYPHRRVLRRVTVSGDTPYYVSP